MKTNLNQLIQSFNPFSTKNTDSKKDNHLNTNFLNGLQAQKQLHAMRTGNLAKSSNNKPLFKGQPAPSDSLQLPSLSSLFNHPTDFDTQRMADRTQTLGYSNITSNNNNNRDNNNQQQRRDSGYFED